MEKFEKPMPVRDDHEDEDFTQTTAASNGDRFGHLDDPDEAAQRINIQKASLSECQDMYRYDYANLTEASEEMLVAKMKNLGMKMKEIDELRSPTN